MLTTDQVGGVSGFESAAIKKAHPSLRLMVQDLEISQSMYSDQGNPELEFMAHDFFTSQTVVADVYLYRFIFHNYPDEKAIEMLRAAIPALKPGAKVVINDTAIPEPGEISWYDEGAARGLDLVVSVPQHYSGVH